jgi:hypothetical protein
MTFSSISQIATANGSRYLQQLCKHWGHNLAVDFTADAGTVTFEPTDQAAFERNMALAREQLGAATYDARFTEGAQWSKAQAIAATLPLRH